MKRACVIGWPIQHSRSPLIHGYWLKSLGIDGAYTKEAVPVEQAETFMRSLAARGLAGCNVTVPHKEAAYRVADIKDASAEAVQAANTLWLESGRLAAANTDTYGYMTWLSECVPEWRLRDAPVAVLGAGGAARAIAYGFLAAGVGEVRVINRSRERAERIAQDFGSAVKAVDWRDRNRAACQAAVVVNTTTLGMKGEGDPDLDFAIFDTRCIVSDIVYVPLETPMLASARAHGLATVDGLGMLLHQAVPGFEKWFGVRPKVTRELYDLVVRDITGAGS